MEPSSAAEAKEVEVTSQASTDTKSSTNPRQTPPQLGNGKSIHRQSFTESSRNVPPSPRRGHPPSFSQQLVYDCMSGPYANKRPHAQFENRNWREIALGEVVNYNDVDWVELDTLVEVASHKLTQGSTGVVLVRADEGSSIPVSAFDFNDLSAYLLIVANRLPAEGEQLEQFTAIRSKALETGEVTMREVQGIRTQEAIVTMKHDETLSKAIEVLGSGIHRIWVTRGGIIGGIMTQYRMVDFFWNERVNFPSMNQLYPSMLRDLGIGNHSPISVSFNSPLYMALGLMYEEGLSSIAVVDKGQNVLGNISTQDLRNLIYTREPNSLNLGCLRFISFTLTEDGAERGQDTFPVFYVNESSTLAHTVAKLVATKSQRMWIVESTSPSPSTSAADALLMKTQPSALGASPPSTVAVPVSAMEGAHASGKLIGVISLSDVLNILARSTGLHPSDPWEQRERRRRSSSCSVRPSLDLSRTPY